VCTVSQKLNLTHLCDPLGGTEGLLETVRFKKTMEWVWWRTSANARWEWVTVRHPTNNVNTLKACNSNICMISLTSIFNNKYLGGSAAGFFFHSAMACS